MGNCASSKIILQGENRIPLPPGLKPIQRKLEDAKKRRHHGSKTYSIVSTTELLSQENTGSGSDSSSGKANPSAIVPEPIPEEEEEELKKEGQEVQEIHEEMPGSPSFRFYCMDNLPQNNRSFDSNDSVKLSQFRRAENIKETDEKIHDSKTDSSKATVKSQVSNEGSEVKSTKREKGRKLLTLPKAPGAVQNLFTCYSNTNATASNQQRK